MLRKRWEKEKMHMKFLTFRVDLFFFHHFYITSSVKIQMTFSGILESTINWWKLNSLTQKNFSKNSPTSGTLNSSISSQECQSKLSCKRLSRNGKDSPKKKENKSINFITNQEFSIYRSIQKVISLKNMKKSLKISHFCQKNLYKSQGSKRLRKRSLVQGKEGT